MGYNSLQHSLRLVCVFSSLYGGGKRALHTREGCGSSTRSLALFHNVSKRHQFVVVCRAYLGEGLVERRACRHFGEFPDEHGSVAGGRQLKGELKGQQPARPPFCNRHIPNEFGIWARSCTG